MIKSTLQEIAKSLSKSTYTDWAVGDLDDFRIWAKQMRQTIETVVPIINNIAENIKEKEIEVEKII